ncbi:MAG: M48 family metalloprotease [Oscillospiraceae bacterium]|nr:M48 family metalloprotease [Oscillospiraceae bacterium]
MFGTVGTADHNPLLDIDTSFAAYLNARTRSYKDHIVGGAMDYAFDADFSVKQKITTFSSWSKVHKNLISKEIPNKLKRLFQSTDVAGSLKYSEIYDAVKVCAERMQISVPTAYVRNAPNKYEIYSVAAEGTEPFIVVTSGLADICTKEELRFLVGCECGHIQNNHCIFNMAAPYFGVNNLEELEDYSPSESDSSVKQIAGTISEWLKLSDITSDRAGIICLTNPQDYPSVVSSLHGKGIFTLYKKDKLELGELMKLYDVLHITPARNISLPSDCTSIEKRILAGLEFLSCETLYTWRSDLNKEDVHTVNKQALEVRCEIILNAAKEGA